MSKKKKITEKGQAVKVAKIHKKLKRVKWKNIIIIIKKEFYARRSTV